MADDKWLETILKSISEDISRVEGMVERVENKVERGFESVNNRVRSLENWRAYIVGIFTAITVGVSLLIKYLL